MSCTTVLASLAWDLKQYVNNGPSPLKLNLVGWTIRKSCMRLTRFWESHIKESPGGKYWRISFSTNLREEEKETILTTEKAQAVPKSDISELFLSILFMNDYCSVTTSLISTGTRGVQLEQISLGLSCLQSLNIGKIDRLSCEKYCVKCLNLYIFLHQIINYHCLWRITLKKDF